MDIEITLVANAGLIIGYRGQKLLLDGLHSQQDSMFSPVPPYMQERIMKGNPPFDHIRWVVFTHIHADHFSGEIVNQYLQAADPEMLVIPSGGEQNISAPSNKSTCTIQSIALPIGQCREINLHGLGKLIAFSSKHAGTEYKNVNHLCYALYFGSKKLLILGDADYDITYLKQIAGREVFDAVIVNPLFLHLPKGRKVLTQSLQTKEIIFYHLPFAKDDWIHFRDMMAKDMKQYKEMLPPMRALTDPLQTVSI